MEAIIFLNNFLLLVTLEAMFPSHQKYFAISKQMLTRKYILQLINDGDKEDSDKGRINGGNQFHLLLWH
jgi:hypothetical protein